MKVWRVSVRGRSGRTVIAENEADAIALYRNHMHPRFPHTAAVWARCEGPGVMAGVGVGMHKQALLDQCKPGVIVPVLWFDDVRGYHILKDWAWATAPRQRSAPYVRHG